MSPLISSITPILQILTACLLSLLCAVSTHAEGGKKIPRSEISKAAYQRLEPQLEQEMRKKNMYLGQPVFMRIFKEENELEVWIKKDLTYELFKTYSICKYSGKLGPKLREGDEQSPEGFYTVSPAALNPWSNFHLSFNLGYPNEFDRIHKRTGGALMVHGKCTSVGCFAMNDFRIEEIYTIVDAAMSGGQEQFAVHIFPFHMTWDKMAKNAKSPWLPFWENLKQGYDYFQGHRNPPMVTVEEQQYAFHTYLPLLFGSDLIVPDQPEKVEYASVIPVAKKKDVYIAKREEIKVVKRENTKVVRREYAKIDKNASKNRKTF